LSDQKTHLIIVALRSIDKKVRYKLLIKISLARA